MLNIPKFAMIQLLRFLCFEKQLLPTSPISAQGVITASWMASAVSALTRILEAADFPKTRDDVLTVSPTGG